MSILPVSVNGAKGPELISVGALLKMAVEPQAWVVHGLLPSGGISVTAAKPKVGKTTWLHHLAYAVATGERFLGRETKQGPVIYIGLEDKRSEDQDVFTRMGATGETPLYLHMDRAPLDSLRWLKHHMLTILPVLVVIDPIVRFTQVRRTEDYSEVSAALAPILELARNSGSHIAMSHHSGKADREGMDSILGSTAWFGGVDTAILMKRRLDQRTFETIQRFGADIPPTIITLDPLTAKVHAEGSASEVKYGRQVTELKALLEAEGSMTRAQLRGLMGGMASEVDSLLAWGVEKGWLTKEINPKRRDSYLYSLTTQTTKTSLLLKTTQTSRPLNIMHEGESHQIQPLKTSKNVSGLSGLRGLEIDTKSDKLVAAVNPRLDNRPCSCLKPTESFSLKGFCRICGRKMVER